MPDVQSFVSLLKDINNVPRPEWLASMAKARAQLVSASQWVDPVHEAYIEPGDIRCMLASSFAAHLAEEMPSLFSSRRAGTLDIALEDKLRISPARPGTVHEMRGYVFTELQLEELVHFVFEQARRER